MKRSVSTTLGTSVIRLAGTPRAIASRIVLVGVGREPAREGEETAARGNAPPMRLRRTPCCGSRQPPGYPEPRRGRYRVQVRVEMLALQELWPTAAAARERSRSNAIAATGSGRPTRPARLRAGDLVLPDSPRTGKVRAESRCSPRELSRCRTAAALRRPAPACRRRSRPSGPRGGAPGTNGSSCRSPSRRFRSGSSSTRAGVEVGEAPLAPLRRLAIVRETRRRDPCSTAMSRRSPGTEAPFDLYISIHR